MTPDLVFLNSEEEVWIYWGKHLKFGKLVTKHIDMVNADANWSDKCFENRGQFVTGEI